MKKVFLLLFIFSFNSYSQFLDAELSFIGGTSKIGIARINILNDKIIFRTNKDSKKEKYNHKQISKLVLKKDSISNTYRYKKTLGRRAPKLLQVIKEDKNLSLYAVVTESNFLYSYGLIGALATTLVDANKINYEYYIVKSNNLKASFMGSTEYTSRKRLREIIKKRLKDCSQLLKKSENKEFKAKDIPMIVDFYNLNCNRNQ